MATFYEMIPDLARWNDGRGIAPEEWAFMTGQADRALALCSLLWPDLVEFEDYVLRRPFEVERLRGWESAGHTRQQIETAMNAFLFKGIFPDDPAPQGLKKQQLEHFATVMTEMLSAKLARDFRERRFSTFVMEGEDFGVSFCQV